MNDKWINDLEQKMKDHTEIAPEGLWDDLEQQLFGKEKGKIIPLWSESETTIQQKTNELHNTSKQTNYKRIVGIVASVTILLIGGVDMYLRNLETLEQNNEDKRVQKNSVVKSQFIDDEIRSIESQQKSTKEHVVEQTKEHVSNTQNKERRDNLKKQVGKFSVIALTEKSNKEEGKQLNVVVEQVSELPAATTTNYSIVDKKEEGKVLLDLSNDILVKERLIELVNESNTNINKTLVQNDNDQLINKEERVKKNKGFALGLLSGNLTSGANMQQSGYGAMMGMMKLGHNTNIDYGIASSMISEIYLANQNKEIYTDVKHKKPIRFGVSLYYPLSEKWGINTGITYTKLSSDIVSGSQDYKIMSNQTLHYIGLPIQVNHNVWEKGNFSTYVNAGIHFEKSVYGSLKVKYQAEDRIEKQPDEKLLVKEVQTSVNFGVGIEYKLANGIGLFLEPGARYYFDNGSSIKTIYTEKPFDFNAQIGLRYSIPTKK
ncbi:porin family protein [Myroides marinus]|uniref:outer membrane beta-barrel protein n=1 Tax=Myroides marinus TaxID=703342 RepID=UPI0025768B4A|nr:outer membrane beta-barrel protein [Myroides marinus]MDM1502001.1 porin family protein [Myroides marinus]